MIVHVCISIRSCSCKHALHVHVHVQVHDNFQTLNGGGGGGLRFTTERSAEHGYLLHRLRVDVQR